MFSAVRIIMVPLIISSLEEARLEVSYLPSKGMTSDVLGMFCIMTVRNTIMARRTVTAKVTFSPLSGGRRKTMASVTRSTMHGNSRLYR